jgi:hypothetical protein
VKPYLKTSAAQQSKQLGLAIGDTIEATRKATERSCLQIRLTLKWRGRAICVWDKQTRAVSNGHPLEEWSKANETASFNLGHDDWHLANTPLPRAIQAS